MTRDELIDRGFTPRTYEGQEGEFLVMVAKLEDMPYASAHLVDGDLFFGDLEAITEVMPNGLIQFTVSDADYVEGPVELSSEEGQALLQDAIASKK